MSVSVARPFGFERIFAANDPERRAQPHELAMQVRTTRAELARLQAAQESALAEARADGFAAGLVQARGETAAALLETSIRVAEAVDALSVQFAETEARISAAASELALAAAEVLAARAIADHPLAAVDDAIGRLLGQVGTREELHICVHPTLSSELRAMIAARDTSGQRPLAAIVEEDDGLAPGDARILWERGGLTLDAAARLASVRAELATLLSATGG